MNSRKHLREEAHRTLVYDSEATGHHREHITHLVRYWLGQKQARRKLVIVGHALLVEEIQETFPGCSNRIDLVSIPTQTIAHLEKQPPWQRSLSEWRLLKKYAHRHRADHCVLMHLNQFQVGIGLLGAGNAFSLSGILFFPYVRIEPPANSGGAAFRYHLRRWRKRLLLLLTLQRARIEKIFVLNDASAAEQLNQALDSAAKRFQALPDPVPPLPQGVIYEPLRKRYDVEPHRHLLLLFGTLSCRKGVPEALRAAAELKPDVARATALLLLGRVKEEDRTNIETALARAQENTHLQLRLDDRFVTPAEMAAAFRECDAVLAPYQRTEGSSGVLGHAARAGKPVVGPASGLVGELIRRYKLGVTVNAARPEEIGNAISVLASGKPQPASRKGMKVYVEERSPRVFAWTVLGAQDFHEPV